MSELTSAARPSNEGRILYYGAAVLAVLFLPDALRYRAPFYLQDHATQAPMLALALVAAAVLAPLAGRARSRRIALAAGVLFLAALGVLAITRWMPLITISRGSALVTLALAGMLIVVGELFASSRILPVAAAGILVVTVGASAFASHEATHPRPSPRTLYTTYEAVAIAPYGQVVDDADIHKGGALARIGGQIIAMTGNGALYRLDRERDDGPVRATRLSIGSPVDFAEFPPALVMPNTPETVRSQHLIARASDEGWQLFLSHHAWHEADRCVTVRVSTATVTPALDGLIEEWRPVADTRPCLPAGPDDPAPVFDGLLSGGRMQWLSENELLITIGDHGWDVLARPVAAAQADDWDYGKIRVLDVRTGELRPFAKGVRNPQGLLVTPEGRIWAAEHGPRGGDELNLVVEGANYGWPYQTYGTNYGEFNWGPAKMDPAKGGQTYTLPRYSWVPSWGISALIQVQANRFPSWTGDLLVGSLAKRTLFRVHLDDDRVVYAEPITMDEEIRDLVETADGEIWLWTDRGTVTSLRPSAAGRTELAVMECARCHTVRTGDLPLTTAPSLVGIMNRPVASDRSYPYSEALRSLGGRWTPDRLREFLTDPQEYAPGTAMPFFGTMNEEEMDSLTAYLGRL